MSINYSALFGDAGAFVKRVNEFRGWAANNLPADLAAISGQLTTTAGTYPSIYALLSDVPNAIATIQNYLTSSSAAYMAGKATARFQELQTVINQLPLGASPTLQQVMAALIVDMLANSQTVQQCVTTVGSVTAAGANNGNTQVLTTKVLDGFNKPRNGANANRNYAGLNSELTVASEEMFLTCTSDQTIGATEGQESYAWTGGQPGQNPWDVTEGSGSGPGIQTLNASGIVQNGEFESWSSNVPAGWMIAAGTAGTNIFKDTSTFYRGLASCRLMGDGSTATITLTQPLINLNALRRYALAVWVRGSGSTGSGTLTISLSGTGYTPGAGEKIQLNAAALSGLSSGFALQSFFVQIPAIPPALSITITVTGTLTNAKSVWLDGLGFGPVNYFGGIGAVMSPGNAPALVGDRYQWSVANDLGGVFQTFARKAYGIQLPSVASSPSISDSLAT